MSGEHETYKLGDWKLKNGSTIPDAHIAYKTFGDSKLEAIIYPTWYSGAIADNEWLIGEDKTLNPKKYVGRNGIPAKRRRQELNITYTSHSTSLSPPYSAMDSLLLQATRRI